MGGAERSRGGVRHEKGGVILETTSDLSPPVRLSAGAEVPPFSGRGLKNRSLLVGVALSLANQRLQLRWHKTAGKQEVDASPGKVVVLPLLPQLQVLDVIRNPDGWMGGWVSGWMGGWVGG